MIGARLRQSSQWTFWRKPNEDLDRRDEAKMRIITPQDLSMEGSRPNQTRLATPAALFTIDLSFPLYF